MNVKNSNSDVDMTGTKVFNMKCDGKVSLGSGRLSSNTPDTGCELFKSHVHINSDLSPSDSDRLYQVLYKHKNVFVTPDNPDMGFTNLVEHKVSLKPDAVSKHQRPYRLPPDKREVLHHQLDELLEQSIIAPVDEHEDVPITSPIVLVAKQNKPKLDLNNIRICRRTDFV